MMKPTPCIWTALLLGFAAHATPSPPADGAARDARAGFEVFDAARGAWVAPDAFWTSFAARADRGEQDYQGARRGMTAQG